MLICALLAEAAVRVYSAVAFPRMMQLEKSLGWQHAADREKSFTNEDGEVHLYVQDEYGQRPLPEALRSASRTTSVLVLGDSFTEAVQVAGDEAFTARLAGADPTLNVINAGVGAYGTVQQYLFLRDRGEAFAPNLVLLVAYENDLTDNFMSCSPRIGPRPRATIEGDEVRIIEDLDDAEFLQFVAPAPFRSFLIKRSYLFYAFNDRVWRRQNYEDFVEKELKLSNAVPVATQKRIFLEMVDRIRDLTEARGARFALALIPSHATVLAGDDPWHAEVAAHAKASGYPFLSLLSTFKDPASGRCYFDKDIHWTRNGHKAAAEALLPFCQEALDRGE
ncbi:SGNH/GDSL hydrolase family protein [Planctomycetes bacterium Poly30]|uniref:SGNH/GDSL hydrolase family protein n=1 Tax=Saltatorellus ferox TaxID=2528018 RepID=UPI0011A7BC3C